jgi:hypothetical protein
MLSLNAPRTWLFFLLPLCSVLSAEWEVDQVNTLPICSLGVPVPSSKVLDARAELFPERAGGWLAYTPFCLP